MEETISDYYLYLVSSRYFWKVILHNTDNYTMTFEMTLHKSKQKLKNTLAHY